MRLYQIYFGTPCGCNNTSGFWLHLPPTTSFTRERICFAPCSQVYIKYNLRETTKYVTLEKRDERRAHVNIRELAKEAGVSVATISRVINHPEAVLPETRERVQANNKNYNNDHKPVKRKKSIV